MKELQLAPDTYAKTPSGEIFVKPSQEKVFFSPHFYVTVAPVPHVQLDSKDPDFVGPCCERAA